MKKLTSILASVIIAFSLCLTVGGCSDNSAQADIKESLTMCVIAGSSYFGDSALVLKANDNANESSSLVDTEPQNARPFAVLEDIPDFNKYIKMFEGYLSTGNTGIVDSALTEEEINQTFGEYTTDSNTVKRVISLTCLNSDDVVYTLYYNEYDANSTTDSEDEETEEFAQIKGVCVLSDGSYYTLTGKRKTEIEKDETEIEFEFVIQKDETTFIKMESSSEVEEGETENEVTLSLYEDGKLSSKTEIEFEKENDEVEMKLKFMNKGENKSKVSYKIKNEVVDGKNVLKVTYKSSEAQGKFKISASDHDYKYAYENGFEETVE